MAGDCSDTCCRGWKIVVDEPARKRFEAIADDALRKDILGHMLCRQQEWRFVNRPDGRCSMLDEDGLCRIQRNLDEKALCNTCRKYPRLSGRVEGQLWLSMAASCPVVAEYLWQGRLGWMWIEDDGDSYALQGDSGKVLVPAKRSLAEKMGNWEKEARVWIDLPRWQTVLQKYYRREEETDRLQYTWKRFQLFLNMAEGCAELLSEFPEYHYLPGSFDYFETLPDCVEEILDAVISFDNYFQKRFLDFAEDYFVYRMFGWRLEQGNISEEAIWQAMGELALLYIISFSRSGVMKCLKEEDILENIRWVYRFCVHGARLTEKIRCFWKDNFSIGQLMTIFCM